MSIFASWGRKAAQEVIAKEIPRMVKEEFERQLDLRLPAIIEDILKDRFKNRPNDPLSAVGFDWALAISLRHFWPELTNSEAVKSLREYIEVPHGHPGYEWSPAAARRIAKQYVEQFGEVA